MPSHLRCDLCAKSGVDCIMRMRAEKTVSCAACMAAKKKCGWAKKTREEFADALARAETTVREGGLSYSLIVDGRGSYWGRGVERVLFALPGAAHDEDEDEDEDDDLVGSVSDGPRSPTTSEEYGRLISDFEGLQVGMAQALDGMKKLAARKKGSDAGSSATGGEVPMEVDLDVEGVGVPARKRQRTAVKTEKGKGKAV